MSYDPGSPALRPGVAAIVTHYNRPHLVNEAICSLLAQTRLPDAVVVLDDASEGFGPDTIIRHPLVSVYRSTVNVGPFRLIEWAIRIMPFDWYLIQDSDDISAPTRLERLLAAASQRNADMVCSAIRHQVVATGETRDVTFTEDACAQHLVGNPLALCLWGSSILSHTLWARVGGIATGLRFSGDAEFVSRACCVGRVINVPTIELLRRIYPDSLTRRPDTGMQSPARKALHQQLRAQADARVAALRGGLRVDLRPFSTAPEIRMDTIRLGSSARGPSL
ncbi:MAG: glycosyltransferase [Phycisphaerales bacterium]|nr:glycosyltransferase [Phycisphaerales bacterium]